MSATKEFDPEIWRRNLRDAPLDDDAACTRWFNNYFVFWLVCETKACKRTKRCAGDADACRDRLMPLVPQRMKFELRAMLDASSERLSPEAMTRRVAEEMARFDETTRVLESLGLATTSSSPLPACGERGKQDAGEGKASAARGPRVRTL